MSQVKKSRAWFPGTYYAVRQLAGIEVLDRGRTQVQISGGTLHGTEAELRNLANQILRVVGR